MYKVPVYFMVSTDRSDYQQIQRTALFEVRENEGEYSIA
jgi:hypothetical protein